MHCRTGSHNIRDGDIVQTILRYEFVQFSNPFETNDKFHRSRNVKNRIPTNGAFCAETYKALQRHPVCIIVC
jgi:hypothetical protein